VSGKTSAPKNTCLIHPQMFPSVTGRGRNL